jgi:hypothetical protein
MRHVIKTTQPGGVTEYTVVSRSPPKTPWVALWAVYGLGLFGLLLRRDTGFVWTTTTVLGALLWVGLAWTYGSQVETESVLMVPGCGLTLSSSSKWFGRQSLRNEFLPLSELSSVFINEGLFGWRFEHYVGLLALDRDEFVLLFPVNTFSCIHGSPSLPD